MKHMGLKFKANELFKKHFGETATKNEVNKFIDELMKFEKLNIVDNRGNAFEHWIKGEGKESNDMNTLTGQPYLRNRLWRAFMAGVAWAERFPIKQNKAA